MPERPSNDRATPFTGRLEPFAQIDDIRTHGFRDLNSHERTKRFEILEGDEPDTVSTDWTSEAARYLPKGAGPVEVDVAGFVMDPRPDLGVLIGGMGSGKSTTLRHLAADLGQQLIIHYLNCDRKAVDTHNPPAAADLLVRFLSPLTRRLMDPREEFEDCWTWGLERYCAGDGADTHNTAMVLERAVEELCLRSEGVNVMFYVVSLVASIRASASQTHATGAQSERS